jgi:hypothetical protein
MPSRLGGMGKVFVGYTTLDHGAGSPAMLWGCRCRRFTADLLFGYVRVALTGPGACVLVAGVERVNTKVDFVRLSPRQIRVAEVWRLGAAQVGRTADAGCGNISGDGA